MSWKRPLLASVVVAAFGAGAVACTPAEVSETPVGVAAVTTSLTTTTLEQLAEVVDVTDRPVIPTLPAGYGGAIDALAQVDVMAAGLVGHDGTLDDRPESLVVAIGGAIGEAVGTGCEVPPFVETTTVGVGPVIGTIDITIGCDDTTDALQFVLTLQQSQDAPDLSTAPWEVVGATRAPRCVRGVSDGLCV